MTGQKKLNGAVNSAVNWAKKYLDCDGTLNFIFEGVKYTIENKHTGDDNQYIKMLVTREGQKVATFQYSFNSAKWERVL